MATEQYVNHAMLVATTTNNQSIVRYDATTDVDDTGTFRGKMPMENSLHQKVQDSLLFTMHVPNLLFSLLIDNIVIESDEHGIPIPRFPQIPRPPIIRRFRGALAFLDISGFTALSQKLDVESLKSHVNSYFSKMISVVDEYGGDVMKFAGDALYIVWPAGSNTSISTAVNKAVSAALRACELCNQHEIIINKPSGQEITYLNVHAGVTYGTMAVCDVGCDNEEIHIHHGHHHHDTSSSVSVEKKYAYSRWETLILGHPLTAVAVCESQATSGEVVCCQGVYNLLRGQEDPNYDCHAYIPNASEKAQNGHGLTSSDISVTPKSAGHEEAPEEHVGDVVFHRREYGTYRVRYEGGRSSREAALTAPSFIRDINNDSVNSTTIDEGGGDALVDVLQDNCKVSFFMHIIMRIKHKWPSIPGYAMLGLKRYIMSSIKGHVHDAARDSMVVDVTSVRQAAEKCDNDKRDMQHMIKGKPVSVVDQAMMVSGEVRKVTALFINIKLNVELWFPSKNTTTSCSPEIDGINESGANEGSVQRTDRLDDKENTTVPRSTSHQQQVVGNIGLAELTPFLTLTEEEQKADQALLSTLQDVMDIVGTSLAERGGQMRQFIHDDKGTVCIGTFGLRGSATDDNSSAAIEAARWVILRLHKIGIGASVGIASGKAFCGLVGSATRHEYAVMGPRYHQHTPALVNLSARLMGAATLGCILCDETTKSSDRSHRFIAQSAINAKGYAAPVAIYQPVWKKQKRKDKGPSEATATSPGAVASSDSPGGVVVGSPTTVAVNYTAVVADYDGNSSESEDDQGGSGQASRQASARVTIDGENVREGGASGGGGGGRPGGNDKGGPMVDPTLSGKGLGVHVKLSCGTRLYGRTDTILDALSYLKTWHSSGGNNINHGIYTHNSSIESNSSFNSNNTSNHSTKDSFDISRRGVQAIAALSTKSNNVDDDRNSNDNITVSTSSIAHAEKTVISSLPPVLQPTASAPGLARSPGPGLAPAVVSGLGMKLLVLSGPFGLGKSLVSKGIFERVTVNSNFNRSVHDPLDETKQLSSNAFSTDYRFKSSCRVDPNDTFTPFLVWKTHITRLLLDPILSGLLSTPYARFYNRRNSNVITNRRPSAAPSLLTVQELNTEDGDDKESSLRDNINDKKGKDSDNAHHDDAHKITTASNAHVLPLLKAGSGKNSNRSGLGSSKSSKSNSLRVIGGNGVATVGGNDRTGSERRMENGNSSSGKAKGPPTTRLKSKPKKSELLHANLKALCDKMEEEDPSLINMFPMLHSLLAINRASMDTARHAAGTGMGTGGTGGSVGKGMGADPLSTNLDEFANEIVPLLVRLIMCVADVLGGPLLFVIDDSQAMDCSSWALLRNLWKCCNCQHMTSTARSSPTTHKTENHRASHLEYHTPNPAVRKATVAVLLTFRTMSEHHHDYSDEHLIAATTTTSTVGDNKASHSRYGSLDSLAAAKHQKQSQKGVKGEQKAIGLGTRRNSSVGRHSLDSAAAMKRADTNRRRSLKGNTFLRVGRTEVSLDYELENTFILDNPQVHPALPVRPASIVNHLTLSLKDPSASAQDNFGPSHGHHNPARMVVKRIDLQTLGKESVAQLVTSLLKEADIQVPSQRPTTITSPRHHTKGEDHSVAPLSMSGRTAHGISNLNETHAVMGVAYPVPFFGQADEDNMTEFKRLLSTVYDASGGNPLCAVEITKAAVAIANAGISSLELPIQPSRRSHDSMMSLNQAVSNNNNNDNDTEKSILGNGSSSPTATKQPHKNKARSNITRSFLLATNAAATVTQAQENSLGGGDGGMAHVIQAQMEQYRSVYEGNSDLKYHNLRRIFDHVTLTVQPSRLEEIVLFRFDQLSSKAQFLLRVCSVAGFKGAPFSAMMLAGIVPMFAASKTQEEIFDAITAGKFDGSGHADSTAKTGPSPHIPAVGLDKGDKTTRGSDQVSALEREICESLREILSESDFLRIRGWIPPAGYKGMTELLLDPSSGKPILYDQDMDDEEDSEEDEEDDDCSDSEGGNSARGTSSSRHHGHDFEYPGPHGESSHGPLHFDYQRTLFEFSSTLAQGAIQSMGLKFQNKWMHGRVATTLETWMSFKLTAQDRPWGTVVMPPTRNHPPSNHGDLSHHPHSSAVFDTTGTGHVSKLESEMNQAAAQAVSSLPLPPLCAPVWNRLGLHWQCSGNNLKAMACFYHAGQLLELEGLSVDALAHFYKAYAMLELVLNQPEHLDDDNNNQTNKSDSSAPVVWPRPIPRDTVKMILQFFGGKDDSTHRSTPGLIPTAKSFQLLLEVDEKEGAGSMEEHDESLTLTNDQDQDLMTLQRVHRLLQGDLLALEIAIKLLIAMSQNVALQAMETNNAATQARNKTPHTARLMTPTMTPRGSYPYTGGGSSGSGHDQTPRSGAYNEKTPTTSTHGGSSVPGDSSSIGKSNLINSNNSSSHYHTHNSNFSSHKTSSDSLSILIQMADSLSVSTETALTPIPTIDTVSPAVDNYDSRSRSTTPTLTTTRPSSPLTKSALFNHKEEAAEAADSLGSFRFLSEALELLIAAWRASWWPLNNHTDNLPREGDDVDLSSAPLASGQAPAMMSSNTTKLLYDSLGGQGKGVTAANDVVVNSNASAGGGAGGTGGGGATALQRRWVLHPVVYGSANPAKLPPHACVATNSRYSQLPNHLSQSNGHSRGQTSEGKGEEEDGFYLRDTSLVFPIFSAVITRFVLRKATWTSDRVSSLFYKMASRHGLDTSRGQENGLKLDNGHGSSSSSIDDRNHDGSPISGHHYHNRYEEAIHVLRAMDARAMVLGQHNRLHEALDTYDRCANMYLVNVHGAAAGDDRNPYHRRHQGHGDHTITTTLDTQSQTQSTGMAALTSSDDDSLVPMTVSSSTSASAHVDAGAVAPIQAAVIADTDTDITAVLSTQRKRLSESMIRIYGADRCAIALSRGAMWNALAGRWTRARELAHLVEPMLATLVLPGTNLLIPSTFPVLRFIGTTYELMGHADKAWLLSQKAMAFARSFSLSQNHLCMVARQTNDVFHEMYRRKAISMALQEKEEGGQTGSNHNNTTSRLEDGDKPRILSSTSSSPRAVPSMAIFTDDDPTISEEVIERVLNEASLSDTLQLTPLSARSGGGGAAVTRNIFALLTDPRSVIGNSRLCVNVSRSYYSAKAEMCSLLGRDWLDAIIRFMTPPTTATTFEGVGLDPGSTSPSPLRWDIERVLDVKSNQWLGSDSSMLPTLAQIKEVLELGLRCADAAIGLFDRSNRSNNLLIGDCALAMRVRGQLSAGLAIAQVLTTHISAAKERRHKSDNSLLFPTISVDSQTSKPNATKLLLLSHKSASVSTLRTATTHAFDDAVTFARNCSLFGVLLLLGIDMVKLAQNTVLGVGGDVDESMLTKGKALLVESLTHSLLQIHASQLLSASASNSSNSNGATTVAVAVETEAVLSPSPSSSSNAASHGSRANSANKGSRENKHGKAASMAASIALDRLLNGLSSSRNGHHSRLDTTSSATTEINETTNTTGSNGKVDGTEDDEEEDVIAYMPLLACPIVREAVLLLSPNGPLK